MKSVTFRNRNLALAGNLYLPKDLKEGQKYPAITVAHPGGGVKEQAAGVYAAKLAEKGFVTLAFDSSYQGDSEGTPHFLDEPMNRVGDIFAAIDYMTTLPFVDAERIGALGICAGGGIVTKAASIDHRIRAVGTVSAVNVGASVRKGWDGKGTVAELMAMLDAVSKQRTAEAAGAQVAYAPYVPPVGDTKAPRDLREAADYYLTPRAQHPNAQNKMLMSCLGAWAGFDAFDLVDPLLTQPLLIIAGEEAGSRWHSEELYAKAPGEKELEIVRGAAHMDFYDNLKFVDPAIEKISQFFAKHLAKPAGAASSSSIAAE